LYHKFTSFFGGIPVSWSFEDSNLLIPWCQADQFSTLIPDYLNHHDPSVAVHLPGVRLSPKVYT